MLNVFFYLQHPEMLRNWEHAMVLHIYHMLHFDKRKTNAHLERIQVICSGKKVIYVFIYLNVRHVISAPQINLPGLGQTLIQQMA